jgi:hypothetical protein
VPGVSVDEEQRDRLRRAKLAALARDGLGLKGEAVGAGPITALDADGVAVVLVEDAGASALSGALLWAERRGARRLVMLADRGAALLGRLASYFSFGGEPVAVHGVERASLVPVEPEPLPEPAPPPPGSDRFVGELRELGVEVVVEHGVVRGEWLGLEVARLVEWPTETGGDGELHLEVGVGRFDRDATAAARPDERPADSLRRALSVVSQRRHPGAPVHPLQLLARERWLRSTILGDPTLVGASELSPAEMTVEPGGIKDSHPAAAVGTDRDGKPVVVVCSTGVDLGVVPLAADARALHAPAGRLVLAVPPRDRHRATEALVTMLTEPGELLTVEPGWG